MNTEEKIYNLTSKLSEAFDSLGTGKCRSDFAGAYVKDEKLNIILVDNADIDYYKNLLNDDSVVYHYTDISYDELIRIKNMLFDHLIEYGVYSSALIDEKSVIELTVENNEKASDIKKLLKEKGVAENTIQNHFVFVIKEDIQKQLPHFDDFEIISDESCAFDKSVKATKTVYPGHMISAMYHIPDTNKYANCLGTLGYNAKRGTITGFVTAWHTVSETTKVYLQQFTTTSDNTYIGLATDMNDATQYDAAFVPFNSGDGSSISMSRKIYNTNVTINKVATTNTFNTITGSVVHLYGYKNTSTGTVSSSSVDYIATFKKPTAVSDEYIYTKAIIRDTMRITGAKLDHGDSGAPTTYESGNSFTLLGLVSGRTENTSEYVFVSKINNINSALGTTIA